MSTTLLVAGALPDGGEGGLRDLDNAAIDVAKQNGSGAIGQCRRRSTRRHHGHVHLPEAGHCGVEVSHHQHRVALPGSWMRRLTVLCSTFCTSIN